LYRYVSHPLLFSNESNGEKKDVDLVVLEVPFDGATEHDYLIGHALAQYEILVLAVLPTLAPGQFPFPDSHVGQTASTQRYPSSCDQRIKIVQFRQSFRAIQIRKESDFSS
jgi:hypothetical protein